jgi:tetratricopeptide (TPR) repeat protein
MRSASAPAQLALTASLLASLLSGGGLPWTSHAAFAQAPTPRDQQPPANNTPNNNTPNNSTPEPPAAAALPGSPREPRVAIVDMQLQVAGQEAVTAIARGDWLAVLAERDEAYIIGTMNGVEGAIAREHTIDLAASIPLYDQWIEHAPADAGRLHALRAGALWARGDAEGAMAGYNRALELGHRQPSTFVSRGLLHFALDDYDHAIADYSQALEIDPRHEAALLHRAALYVATRQFDSAIADFTSALEHNPRNGVLLQKRAFARMQAGQFEAALADYQAALELDPRDLSALQGRGIVHFQLGQHAAAVEAFTRAIELDPHSAMAFNNRGYNLQQMGQARAALEDYETASRIAPKYGLAWANKAWLLLLSPDDALRNPAAALAAAEAACDLTAYGNVQDLILLAACLAANGQYDKAVRWQTRAVELLPDEHRGFAERILEKYRQNQPFEPGLLPGPATPPATQIPQ